MAENVQSYPTEHNALNSLLGRGTIYTVLGILTALSLITILIVGTAGNVNPGLFEQDNALAIGGMALIVLAVSTLILLFSLTGTIRMIQQQMEDLTRLRQAIEKSYARLQDATESLATEVGDLKTVIPRVRKSVGKTTTTMETATVE